MTFDDLPARRWNGCATGSYPPEAVSQDSSLGLTEGSDNRFESTGDGISKVFKTWPFLTTFHTKQFQQSLLFDSDDAGQRTLGCPRHRRCFCFIQIDLISISPVIPLIAPVPMTTTTTPML